MMINGLRFHLFPRDPGRDAVQGPQNFLFAAWLQALLFRARLVVSLGWSVCLSNLSLRLGESESRVPSFPPPLENHYSAPVPPPLPTPLVVTPGQGEALEEERSTEISSLVVT